MSYNNNSFTVFYKPSEIKTESKLNLNCDAHINIWDISNKCCGQAFL